MPTSRKRKKRDGTEVRFRARPKAAAKPVQAKPKPEPEPDYEPRPRAESLFAAVVGSTGHQERHEDTVFRLVNEVRANAGLSRLRRDTQLDVAARAHSNDMARRDFCAHNNPDGLTPADRMRAAGYPAPGAENVARGQETPHSVMDAWMNSPGHRANLLKPEFGAIGIGAAFVARNGPCWTQNFGY